jgi:hypothetical protein
LVFVSIYVKNGIIHAKNMNLATLEDGYGNPDTKIMFYILGSSSTGHQIKKNVHWK